jgi:hypothetical protein
VITPSLPTFSIASAMIVPIVSSLFAEIVPTWPIMWPLTGLDIFFTSQLDELLHVEQTLKLWKSLAYQ